MSSDPHERFRLHATYIRIASADGQRWLKTVEFDEDWKPVGPRLRADMQAAGLIDQDQGVMILLRPGRDLIGWVMPGDVGPTQEGE